MITEFNVFCVILRSAARFSFTRTLRLLAVALLRQRREETLKKWQLMRTSSTSLWIPQFHMSGMEFLIVQSVFDEAFWRFRSHWFVFTASVKVPYFGDWIINFMNDSNRYLFITCSNQHFWSFLSGCLSNDWWNVFFFEIGRDVEGIEVLEVLSMTYAVFAWAQEDKCRGTRGA